jgi:hypothetical protein
LSLGLVDWLASVSGDPLAYVLGCFPWGEPGTRLAAFTGPEPWQASILQRIRDGLLTPDKAIQEATASGHGVGKSALVSWIIKWAVDTKPDTRGVVTANTETQLKTKTWAELGKWHHLSLTKDSFKLTATAYFHPEHERTWRVDMVPWSERNTEAFAGLHNQGRRILVVFDEASAIPDVIWETTEGALTDRNTQIIWCVFGNPTRNTGRFKECFPGGIFSRAWHTTKVDSREISFTNHEQIGHWIDAYGEDSDFVRVRVKGAFPRVGEQEFISAEVVDQAVAREASCFPHEPLVLGVDVARYGDNETVIFIRKGRDAQSFSTVKLRGADVVTVAGKVSEVSSQYNADAIFVDGGGVGGGVVDCLRNMHVHCFDINFGAKPDAVGFTTGAEGILFANKRAEMWGTMREWLKTGAIANDPALRAQLIGPTYTFNLRNEIQLEKKEDMRKRGLESPDIADALALTFAMPIQMHLGAGGQWNQKPKVESDYDPIAMFEKEIGHERNRNPYGEAA